MPIYIQLFPHIVVSLINILLWILILKLPEDVCSNVVMFGGWKVTQNGLKWRQGQRVRLVLSWYNIIITNLFWYDTCTGNRGYIHAENYVIDEGILFNTINIVFLQSAHRLLLAQNHSLTPRTCMIIMSCASETDDSTPLTVEWIHRGIALRTGDDSRLDITEDHTIIIDVEGLELQEIADRFSGEYTWIPANK